MCVFRHVAVKNYSANYFDGQKLMKEEGIVLKGTVIDCFPNAMFKVKLETGQEVLATICGKIRKFSIRISLNDNVLVELSPYDLTRGRIIRRA